MLVSWVFAVISFAFIAARLRSQIADDSGPTKWIYPATIALLQFSSWQEENWLWAFQTAFFLVNLGIVGALFFSSKCSKQGFVGPVLGVLLALAASFSSAPGLVIWPLLICVFLLVSSAIMRRAGAIVLTAVVFLVVTFIYFTNYNPPDAGKFGYQGMLAEPVTALALFLGQLGAPLAFGFGDTPFNVISAVAIGTILLILFMTTAIACLRLRCDKNRRFGLAWV